jgi:protein CpxP
MRILTPSALLGAVLISGFTGNVFAQNQPADTTSVQSTQAQPHKAPDPQRQAKHMAKKFGLTADQQAKIEPILADRDQQVQILRANTSLAPNDRKAQLRSVVKDSDSKIEAFLNDNQKQQYEQLKQNRHAKRQKQSDVSTNS